MVTYQLREKVEGKESSVQIVIANIFSNHKRLKIGIGVSIKPEEFGSKGTFDQETGKLKDNFIYRKDFINKSKRPSTIVLKNRIEIIESCITETRSSFAKKGRIPTTDEFRVVFDEYRVNKGILASTKVRKNESQVTINKNMVSEFFRNYIEECKNLLINNTPIVKQDTIKKYNSVFNHWLNFEELKKQKFMFSELTEVVVVDFMNSCNLIKSGEVKLKNNYLKSTKCTQNPEGYSKQSIDNISDIFTGIVNKAAAEGIKNDINMLSPKLKVKKAGRRKEYFINEELLLNIIESKPKSKLTQNARDYVILASTTGMRYQSIIELSSQKIEYINVDGNDIPIVKNIAKKTDDITYSILFKNALEIYKSNGDSFPKFYALSYLNDGLRKLFRELKINDKLSINHNTYGGVDFVTQELVSDHLSSHDCRSTFITNLLLHGVNRDTVKSMTHEHNSGDAFSLYDKTSSFDQVKSFYRSTKNLKSPVYTY